MKKRFWVLLTIAIIVLFVIIYVLPGVGGKLVQTTVAEYDRIRITDEIQCYFVRDEMVITAGSGGDLTYLAQEGEKVRKGMEVFKIQPRDVEAEVSLAQITNKMNAFNSGDHLFTDDLKKIDETIADLTEELEQGTKKKDEASTNSLQNKINKLKAKREQIAATVSAGKEEEKRLESLAESITANVEKSGTSYQCKQAGTVSYYIDGYESEFTPENMRLLSKEKVEKQSYEVINTKRSTTAENEPVAKIVKGNVWYGIAWIEKDDIVKYKQGNTVSLALSDDTISGTLVDILDQNGEYLIVIKFTKYYEKFAQIRQADVEMVTMDAQGLKVRNDSITAKNGQAGVYVKSLNGTFSFKPVKILSSNGEFTIVESGYYDETKDNKQVQIETINLYDEIKRNPGKAKTVTDEKTEK